VKQEPAMLLLMVWKRNLLEPSTEWVLNIFTGFWADPPGYFDKIVWPNYCQDHKYLFIDGDVEGSIKPAVEEQRHIHTPQTLNISAEDTLEWAVDILIHELKSRKQSATL